jgi:hypothetical protein
LKATVTVSKHTWTELRRKVPTGTSRCTRGAALDWSFLVDRMDTVSSRG